MSDERLYNIPADRSAHYANQSVVLRSTDPAALIDALSQRQPESVAYLQLLSMSADSTVLIPQAEGLPIDLMMSDPAKQFSLLYHHTELLERHPVRVTIPLQEGFFTAVKQAISLQFSVKITLGQPDVEQIKVLIKLADYYLHNPLVSQPVEFLHSLFFAFLEDTPAWLWSIQEEHPAEFCFVTDQGEERFGGKLFNPAGNETVDHFFDQLDRLIEQGEGECSQCDYFPLCGGYFKWPRIDYRCDGDGDGDGGVKRLFDQLRGTAQELYEDLDRFSTTTGTES